MEWSGLALVALVAVGAFVGAAIGSWAYDRRHPGPPR
jgi:hypothetical protein